MQTPFEQAQWLANDAKNISNRIAELGSKDAIPLKAIREDIADIMYEYSKLRIRLRRKKE